MHTPNDIAQPSSKGDSGFTLIELMIVVIIVGVLAALALTGYSRYMRRSRVVAAQEMVARIQARQEIQFQQTGRYLDVSVAGDFYPPLVSGNEPSAKEWNAVPAEWVALGARPEDRRSYFSFHVRASDPNAMAPHQLFGVAAQLQIAPQPATTSGIPAHPWYYIVAHGDLNGDASYTSGGCSTVLGDTHCTILAASSGRSTIAAWNVGE